MHGIGPCRAWNFSFSLTFSSLTQKSNFLLIRLASFCFDSMCSPLGMHVCEASFVVETRTRFDTTHIFLSSL